MKILFFAVILNIVAYMLIWWFGRISSDVQNPKDALFTVFHWKAFLIIISANIVFSLSLFYYFKTTPYPVAIAIGVGALVSFLMSFFFAGGSANIYNITGILLTVIGIFLMFK